MTGAHDPHAPMPPDFWGPDRRGETDRPRDRDSGGGPTTGAIRQLLGPVTGGIKLGLNAALGRGEATAATLRVDWPQCKAHGVCAELAPEVIHLDEWGFPIVKPGELRGEELAAVRKAVAACPTLALKLIETRA